MTKLYLALTLLLSVVCLAQNPADRDPTFNMFEQPLNQYFVGTDVTKTVVLPDGKIMVLEGNSKLIKLDNNLLDNSFQLQAMTAASGFNGVIIDDFCVMPDGKIIIAGAFATYAGQARRDIARLHPDGTLDTAFNYPGNMTRIGQVIGQPDGSVVFHGGYPVRLIANGSVDPTFAVVTNISYGRMARQQDGKILVTHSVSGNYNNGVHKLSRLNLNGTIDATFTTASFSIGANGEPDLFEVVVQQDGKILVGGHFSSCNGTMLSGIVRLNINGIVDTTFNSGIGFNESTPYSSNDRINEIVEQADHKLLVGGLFTHYNSVAKRHIVRLNPDASIDESFLAPDDFINHDEIYSIALTADNNIFVGGGYDFGQNYDSYLVKLLPDGTKNTSFSNISKGFFHPHVVDVLETGDGKLLVAGEFHTYNDQFCYNFTRLNSDGSPDTTLTYGGLSGFQGPAKAFPTAIAQREDGKIYIGGTFTTYNGAPARTIIRINPDGTRDMSFNAGNGVDYNEVYPGTVSDILAKPDGGVLVAGDFENVAVGTSSTFDSSGLISYSPTGSMNLIYPEAIVGNDVTSIKYQADGKLLVGTKFDGLLRFNSGTTTLDDTFIVNNAVQNGKIYLIEVLPDGRIMVQGEFTIGGVTKNLVRLNPDGSMDITFNFTLDNTELQIDRFKLLPDGKLMVSTRPGLYDYNRTIRRLNNNGSLDLAFEQQTFFLDTVDFLPLSSGKLLLYGWFSSYQGKPALGMIRLMGEDYNFLQGQNRLDANLNGCDTSDSLFANVKFSVSGASGDFDFISNTTGNYLIGMSAGAYTITPEFENPGYFAASPPSVAVNFPSQQSPLEQQFCITPVGVHPDLEAVVMPLTDARPGFDATYQLIYKNKGNLVQSGTVSLAFDDASTDLVSASPAAATTSANLLQWNFSLLQPYETRKVLLKFNLNSPTETPALTSGSILPFTASVVSALTDDQPADNVFEFNQTVVNSYDPNDKTCLEGEAISSSQVGDFVHYVIRFENNGTAAAQDVTVRDIIDADKYEISSLVPMSGSHLFVTRIVNGNQIDFFFENINLPFADATNDGFVSFKIRTKSSLAVGDSFSNSAAIYFDYNFPVITNTATTTVEMLGVAEIDNTRRLSVYPNPAVDVLYINNPDNINITSVSVYNMAGQLLFVLPNYAASDLLDVSHLSTGSYIAVFKSGEGDSSVKFIKK